MTIGVETNKVVKKMFILFLVITILVNIWWLWYTYIYMYMFMRSICSYRKTTDMIPCLILMYIFHNIHVTCINMRQTVPVWINALWLDLTWNHHDTQRAWLLSQTSSYCFKVGCMAARFERQYSVWISGKHDGYITTSYSKRSASCAFKHRDCAGGTFVENP